MVCSGLTHVNHRTRIRWIDDLPLSAHPPLSAADSLERANGVAKSPHFGLTVLRAELNGRWKGHVDVA